jgi:tetratricopeptide (TPR) repeat protein
MNFNETLAFIAAAQGKPDQLALATVEIVLAGQPPAEQAALRAALDAAALPHWFDAALLGKLLPPDLAPRANELFARLCALPFTERFAARGETAHNVHEATRLPWRARLRASEPERFRELSRSAVAALPAPTDPAAAPAERIEALYHRLGTLAAATTGAPASGPAAGAADDLRAGPEVGAPRTGETAEAVAAQCEALAREWERAGRTDERQALAAALGELDQAGELAGLVRAVALLAIAEARWNFQPLEVTGKSVATVFKLCEAAGDGRRLAWAWLLRGQLAEARGELASALTAFEQCLSLRRECARQRPGDAELENELADSHFYIGGVQLAQGDLAGARAAFEATLALNQKPAALDPANAVWQRELAVSHSRVGDVRLAQGDLAGARAAFEATLALNQKLAALDPANADWQRDLAVSYSRAGDVRLKQGDLAGARAAFEAYHAIRKKLAELDPSNTDSQRGLAVSHSRVGDVRLKQGDLAGAWAAFGACLAISQRLAVQDPANAAWQRDLALAHHRVGDVARHSQDFATARREWNQALAIFERLTKLDPTNADWRENTATLRELLGELPPSA